MTGRSFMSAWWLLSLVLSATYCGNLIAFLTVTKEKMPFDTLAQMAQMAGSYKWGTIGGTLWEDNFMTSENPTYKEVGNGIREFNKSDPTVLAKSPKFHVDRADVYARIGVDGKVEATLVAPRHPVVGTPQSTTGRSFLSAWWLLSIVVSATYCGNLIAFLTVTKEKMPFDTLAQMADVGGQ
ncbi:IR93A-like protein, partial [Mya arenaria]